MDHAPFIWSSYGLTAVILLWTAIMPLFKQKSALRKMRQLEKRQSQMAEPHDTNT